MTGQQAKARATALARNKYICEMADKIIFVGVTPKSSLYTLMENNKSKINPMNLE